MKTTLVAKENDITMQGQKNLDKMSNFIKSNVGTILDGKYEIKREIARGGMGIVYEAYHKYTHKRVAIKVILADQVEPIQLKRFQEELEAYSLLSHPNVITIYDAGVYNNYPYIVMEYIEGVDICTYVKQQEEKNTPEDSKKKRRKQKGRDWRLCARLIYETALGLEYIHSKNMIHRDIKPANIIVRPNGSPVIIDLGLVKFNRSQSWNLTKSREIIGTIEYMPIEQAQGKRGQIDARTDVYSLGLVLYELLTEQIAYNSKNIMEAYYKIMSYYPPLPREINPKIPEVLEEITIHAMEKQKEKRYASMKEFSDALKEYLSDTTVKPTPQYAQIKKRLWIERNKNKVLTSCITVLLAIVLVIIVSILGKQTISNTSKNDKQLQNNELPKNATNNATKENRNFEKLPDLENNSIENPEEEFQLGAMYYNKQDYAKAFALFEKSANQGNAKAQNELGFMYYNGQGVKQDFKKAFALFEKSAKQGDAEAQCNLGSVYYNGDGVKQDFEKAFSLFEKSAKQGKAEAQFALGVMYEKGQGVAKDFEKAIYWYEQAANQGNAKAQNNLGLMYENGRGVAKDFEKAIYWYEQATNQGLAEAQYNLGLMYYEGQGVEKDFNKAFYWYEKSAKQGFAEAQYNLGLMYHEGQGVEKDFNKAREWYKKAASQGHKEAKKRLDVMQRKD